jgi:hypothetical protein
VKQHQHGLCRRWFEDEFFDLIVWYDQRQEIFGFQLCYEKSRDEHALTWLEDRGYGLHRIDTGEQSVWETSSPVLIADGAFPRQQIIERFLESSKAIDPNVVQYVVQKLEQYG